MAKRKGKSVSFDAMVKFFMLQYDIPTKQDVDRLIKRLDQIEALIRSSAPTGRNRRKAAGVRQGQTATDTVFNVIGKTQDGIGIPDIQTATGLGEKKVRNIIFRLHKLGKIQRKSRGIYIAV